jgi:peroxiredoxin
MQGKRYILIDFWSSDVAQCAVDAKELAAAYRKYQSKGFEILSISLDENKDAWLKAISQQGRKWTNLSDLKRWQSAVVKLYKIESLPSNVLIDDKGTIIARNLKGEHLINTLNQIF